MLYCWIVVVRDRLMFGSVCDGLTNCTVPPVRTNLLLLRRMSPPVRLARPRITGSASVPRTWRFADPPTLAVLLTRFTLLEERTARFSATFSAKLRDGGA